MRAIQMATGLKRHAILGREPLHRNDPIDVVAYRLENFFENSGIEIEGRTKVKAIFASLDRRTTTPDDRFCFENGNIRAGKPKLHGSGQSTRTSTDNDDFLFFH